MVILTIPKKKYCEVLMLIELMSTLFQPGNYTAEMTAYVPTLSLGHLHLTGSCDGSCDSHVT